ncbi:MAG: hypothetical protein KBT01_02055, partial [Clostridiales bacterium]|nr:hypothetical protein [Candidatus Blautia equi]
MKKKFMKKSAAAVMSAAMVLAAPAAVSAADYLSIQKESLGEFTTSLAEGIDALYASVDDGAGAFEISTQFSDTAKLMFSMGASIDLSWLDNALIRMDWEADKENLEIKSVAAAYLNDQELLHALLKTDYPKQLQMVLFPELTGAVLSSDLNIRVNDESVDEEEWLNLLETLKDPAAYAPDGQTTKELLDRHLGIALEYVEVQESSDTTLELAVGDFPATIYEAKLTNANVDSMFYEIAETMKDDEQLAQVIQNFEKASPELEGLYDDFVQSMERILEEHENEAPADETETGEDAYLLLNLFTDEEGQVIGRTIGAIDSDGDVKFSWAAPVEGDTEYYTLLMESDSSTMELYGSGERENGLLSGTYMLCIDGERNLRFRLDQVDTKAFTTGKIMINLADETADQDQAEMMESMGIKMLFNGEGEV